MSKTMTEIIWNSEVSNTYIYFISSEFMFQLSDNIVTKDDVTKLRD